MKHSKVVLYSVAVGVLCLLLGWLYSYNYYSGLEYEAKFSKMNSAYRKLIRAVERDRSSLDVLLREYRTAWDDYYSSYRDNPPRSHEFYANWSDDLAAVDAHLRRAEPALIEDDKKRAYDELHAIRMIWRNIWMNGNPKDYRFYIIDLHDPVMLAVEYASGKNEDEVQRVCPDLKMRWRALKDKLTPLEGDDLDDYKYRVNDLGDRIMDLCNLDVTLGRLPRLGQTLKNVYGSLYLNYG